MTWGGPRAGGQFLRAVAQRCQGRGYPRMGVLVTMGGQHQGVMNVPECWNPSFNMTPSALCAAMQTVLGFGAYLPFIRDRLVQAQYFKVRALLCCPSLAWGCLPPWASLPRQDRLGRCIIRAAIQAGATRYE